MIGLELTLRMSDVSAAASQVKKEFRELLIPLTESLKKIKLWASTVLIL